jgi:hypothetical protein
MNILSIEHLITNESLFIIGHLQEIRPCRSNPELLVLAGRIFSIKK